MSREVKGKKFGRRYLDSFKKDVVMEVEREGSLALICERHNLSSTNLQHWMDEYGSEAYHLGKSRRRSLSEREGIARDIVSGHLSLEESMLKHNAKSRDTVMGWVKDYKKRQQELLELLPLATVLAIPENISGTAPSADLKLAELKIRALEVMLDIASKEFKVDIRKKFGAKQ